MPDIPEIYTNFPQRMGKLENYVFLNQENTSMISFDISYIDVNLYELEIHLYDKDQKTRNTYCLMTNKTVFQTMAAMINLVTQR